MGSRHSRILELLLQAVSSVTRNSLLERRSHETFKTSGDYGNTEQHHCATYDILLTNSL